MKKFYFTFGSNHLGLKGTPEEGKSLFKKYVVVNAENHQSAREAMIEKYSTHWAFSYNEHYFKGQAKQYNLTELETIDA